MATKKPIGTAEAAEMSGVLPQTVVRLIRDGEIQGFKVRDVWRVYREDVEAYIQRQMEKARQVATDRIGDSTRSCSPVCAHPPVSSSIGYPRLIMGRSSRLLRQEFAHLQRLPVLWSPSYFLSTAGNVSSETIARYIQQQSEHEEVPASTPAPAKERPFIPVLKRTGLSGPISVMEA